MDLVELENKTAGYFTSKMAYSKIEKLRFRVCKLQQTKGKSREERRGMLLYREKKGKLRGATWSKSPLEAGDVFSLAEL